MSELRGRRNPRDGAVRSTNNYRSKSYIKDWRSRLILNDKGKPVANVANAITALRHAPEWRRVLHFNESKMATCAKFAPPFERAPAMPLTWCDEQDILTAAWLQNWGISVNKEIAAQAVQTVAREHPFHPVRDYLNSLKWDKTPRIAYWLTLYLGADPSDYTRAVAEKWMIGAVARIYRPGCKVDSCLILEGPQGALKSTALRVLAGNDFFTDDIADLGSKDSVIQTRGVWVIELAELDSMSRPEASRVKAFMSRQLDRIRLPYEVWAEARERFKSGANWWLDVPELVEAAKEEQQARYEGDAWTEKIGEFALTRTNVSIDEILESCIEKPKKDWTRGDQQKHSRGEPHSSGS